MMSLSMAKKIVMGVGAMCLLALVMPIVRRDELAQTTASRLPLPASISDRKHMLTYLKTQVRPHPRPLILCRQAPDPQRHTRRTPGSAARPSPPPSPPIPNPPSSPSPLTPIPPHTPPHNPQSWTPSDEEHYLAGRLGVAGEAAATNQQALHSATSAAAPAVVEAPARPTPEREVRESRYNVPYFSSQLRPRYIRPGMHAAAATYKDALRDQGVVLDNGHYLNAAEDRQLAEELDGSQMVYATKEEANPYARRSSPALKTPEERALADQLVAGQRYAYLANHGEALAGKPTRPLSAKEGASLAQQLASGLDYANVGAWQQPGGAAPVSNKPLSPGEAAQLAKQLEGGMAYVAQPNLGRHVEAAHLNREQATQLASELGGAIKYAELPNFGRPVLTAEQQGLYNLAKEQALVRSLSEGELDANLGGQLPKKAALRSVVPGEMMTGQSLVQSRERRAWGIAAPATAARELSAPQAHNLHRYLKQGLRQVFGSRQVPTPKYAGPSTAKKLYTGYMEGVALESNLGVMPKVKYVSPKEGIDMAASMKKSIGDYQAMSGAYVGDFLRQVEGSKFQGAHQAGPKSKAERDAEGRALSKTLNDGIRFVEGANKKAAESRGKAANTPHPLSAKDGKSLAEYLQPAHMIARGQAPALGYAV